MMRKVMLFMLWFLVWGLLSWPLDIRETAIGAFAALFILFMTADMFQKTPHPSRSPIRYLWFLYYIAVFIWECLKANIDVAYRVLHPDLPIRPGTLRIKTSLRSDAGLTFLANSVTLTPGTTSVDVDAKNGILYVHWIYVKESYDKKTMKLPAVDKFEKILMRIFT